MVGIGQSTHYWLSRSLGRCVQWKTSSSISCTWTKGSLLLDAGGGVVMLLYIWPIAGSEFLVST